MKIPTKINPLNVPRWVCEHLLGPHHTHAHRIGVGIIIMFVGVYTSKIHVDYMIVHFILDCGGYLIHGIGAIPIVEFLAHINEEKETTTKND